MKNDTMNVCVESVRLWLRTYESILFTDVNMPGSGKGKMVLNQTYAAQRADEVVEEFNKRYNKKFKNKGT